MSDLNERLIKSLRKVHDPEIPVNIYDLGLIYELNAVSRGAQVTTKPQLEIYADDVRCTHGATSGELDEDSLFYLKARGVPDATARLLLLHAFAGENVDRIEHEDLRDTVREIINDRLAAALGRSS